MINKPGIVEHIKQKVDFDLLDVKWVPKSANVCVFGADKHNGFIQCFQMNSNAGKLDLLTTIQRSKPIKCGSFGMSSNKQVVTGDIMGRLQIM